MDYGVFRLADTDKMGLQPNCTCVGVCVRVGQRERLNTFFIGVSVLVPASDSVNTPLFRQSLHGIG